MTSSTWDFFEAAADYRADLQRFAFAEFLNRTLRRDESDQPNELWLLTKTVAFVI